MLQGRGAERARLEELVGGLQAGRSFALLLEGPAGIGKTTLLEHAAAAVPPAVQVVRATGHEAETHIPYAALADLVGPLLGLRDRLTPRDAAALDGALALSASAAGDDPFAVPAAVLGLLGVAAEDAPVLAVVDDAQWLDEASREALLFAAARVDAEGIGLILAARDGHGDADARPIVVQDGLERLALGGLEDDDARALLAAEREGLAPEVVDALVAAGHGNPLALRELSRAVAPGAGAGGGVGAAAFEPFAPGGSAEALFARRLEALDAPARRALCALAALGGDDHAVLEEALTALGSGPEALEAARRSGLLVARDGGALAFSHPLLASAAYHGEPTTERRAVHAALARATRSRARAAWHLSAAATGPDEGAAEALDALATLAAASGAHGDAARAASRAAELTPAPDDRARRRLQAAAQFAVSGDAPVAADLLAAAVEDDPSVALPAASVRAEVAVRGGRPAEAVALLEAAATAREEEGDGDGAARALLQASLAHMYTGDMRALIDTGERARALAGDGDVAVLAGLLCGEGLAALGRDREAAPLLDEAGALMTSGEAPVELAEVVAMGALCSAWLERFARAERTLDLLVDAARAAGAAGRLAYPLAVRSHVGWRRGRWRSALADADEATRLARETGQLAVVAAALPALARAEAGVGRVEEARAHGAEALAMAEAAGADAIVLWARAALGFGELSAGAAQAAAEHLDAAAATAARGLGQPALTMFAADHVEALLRVGREAEARAAADELAAAAERSVGRWAGAAAARCAVLLAADEEVDAAVAAARRAHEGLELPFERARTALAIGERLHRAGRRADARAPLQDAVAAFARLGARPWAERARGELLAAGAPAPAVADADGAAVDLSPRELQVALLVAQGQTNREVAAALFLSPKTVEHHLGAIYRRLGLRSRTQLATFIAEDSAERAA